MKTLVILTLIYFKPIPSPQVLPSQPGIRPDYLKDLRHSTLKELPFDKRNSLFVTLQLLCLSLRDIFRDPYASAKKIFGGLHGDIGQLPALGIIAAVVISLWGLRLSYNFWRKVGGHKSEPAS